MNHIDHARDARGAILVRVHFAARKAPAVLYLTDYERVQAVTGNASWFLNSSGNGHQYVRTKQRGTRRNVMVAKLILGSERETVRYQDGDSLNLRRENLTRPKKRADLSRHTRCQRRV